MHPFRLDFAAPPHGAVDSMLATAPGFRLVPPDAGWICCHVEGADFLPIRLSNVFPPLADLWLWSAAVARDLVPVTVRIDEEGSDVFFAAEKLPQGHLRLSLIRRVERNTSIDPGRLIDAIAWTEERHVFLARWGALWAAYCQDDGLPWIEWNRFEDRALPEPMRDMPWEELADIPAWQEAPPWTCAQRIAWFYLQMAHHLRSRGHRCEYPADPANWTLRELAFARLSIGAAQAAWKQVREDDPPLSAALRRIDEAQALALEYPMASAQDERARRLDLFHVYLEAMQAKWNHIVQIVDGCLPHLPIAAGSFIADERGRRAVIVRAQRRRWLLYWDDGCFSWEGMFYARHRPICRWPITHGPLFDPDTLDEIDARRLRFLELDVSPVCVVCPVCGYPCMDDDVDDVQSCDICGYHKLWELTYGCLPLHDATVDDEGDPISPTLRERRAFFLEHGDAWPADHVEAPDDDTLVNHLRHPERQRLARECMAEWDAWLDHPDPDHTPEEVWRRWQDEQRQKGGHDDA